MEIAIVLSLLLLAIILFVSEKYSIDVVTVGLLILLMVFGIISPQEAFDGFSHDFIIILASIFIITGALTETGVLDRMGAKMVKVVTHNKTLFFVYILLFVCIISAFMNNTTVVALVIGPVVGMCRKLEISPSKVLMPVAFATILGGTCTLIGTSTNVAVSGYISHIGMETLGFFEFVHVGLILSATGIIFIFIFKKWLLPDYKEVSYTEGYAIRQYLSEIIIREKSNLIGQPVFDSDLAKENIRILKIVRRKEEFIPSRSSVFEPEDILLVECKLDDLVKVKESSGIDVVADVITDKELQSGKIKLAEVLITPNSRFTNRTLKEVRFRQNFDLVVLAIHRMSGIIATKIGNLRLKTGDLLLLQGTEDSISAARSSNDFTVLGDFNVTLFKERRGLLTAFFFAAAIVVGSFEILPVSVSLLAAALLTVVIGALPPERIYRVIDFRLLVLIGGMSAFGTAMENSGAAVFIADLIINTFKDLGVIWVLAAFVVLTVFLTQPLSNAAAALVVLPVAIQAAQQMNVNPRTFVIAIMLSASVSMITPFEPASILVYSPGKYKFVDFVKAGLPLTLILIALVLLLVPIFWPF